MTDVIGRGIIEIVADATKLQAGISDAKSSLNTLRDAAKGAGETLNAQGIKYIRTLEKQDARLKTQAATFGQGKSEIAAYGAAQLGVAQTADALVKSIAASEAAIKSKAKADRDAAAAAQQLVVQQQAQQQVQRGFLQDLQKKVDVGSGKLPSELAAIKAAQLGVTAQSGPLIAALAAQEKGLGNLATNARVARFQSQQLGFQLHDFFIQLQAGQNPLTAFLQQGSQLSGTFGGAGPAFKAVLDLITPLRAALAGAAVAVTGLGIAMYRGAQQSKEYADALVLSGNFAGQTAATVNTAVKSISASGEISRGAAREAVAAITATGEIGPKAFDASAEAAARFAQATGKSVKDVAGEFAALGRDVTAGATKLNQSFNFLSAAQLQQIRNLQESGQQTEAYSLVIDALNTRLRSLEPNLGNLDKALRFTTNTWSRFWDAAFDVGRPDTIDDKINKARSALSKVQSPPVGEQIDSALDIFNVRNRPSKADRGELAQENLRLLGRSKASGEANAALDAERAALNKSTAEIRARRDAQLDATKTDEARTKALKKLTDEFAQLDKEGRGFTPKQKQILIEEEKRKFEPPKGSRPRVDNSAAREAEQVRRAELDNDLRFLRDKFGEERDTIAFHQRELQAIYSAGNISLQQFYDDRERTITAGVTAELSVLAQEQSRLQTELTKPAVKANQSERVKLEGDLAESIARTAKVEREAGRAATLAGYERAAAYKQLDNAVNDYRANLLQLQGDEAGAARLRAKQAIDQARDLAKQSEAARIRTTGDLARFDRGQTSGGIDVAALARATEQTIQLNQIKTSTSQINQRLSIEEERITLQQRTGSIGEIEALRKIGDARTQIFAQAEKQVVELERLAKERPLDLQLTIDASQARLELEKFSAELDPLKDKFDNLFKDAGSNAFADLLNGKTGIKGALNQFFTQIATDINNTIAKELSQQVFGKGGVLGDLGGIFGDIFGGKKAQGGALGAAKPVIDTSAVTASFANLQTAGIEPAISSLHSLQQAADSAAQAVGRPAGQDPAAIRTTGDFARFDRSTSGEGSIADLFKETDAAQTESARSAQQFGKSMSSATSDVLRLAQASGTGSSALNLLPSIIGAIASAGSAAAGSGGGGGVWGSILSAAASFFGGGSYSANGGVGYSNAAGISGGREKGGPVEAGKMYRVAEQGPELLRIGSDQMILMMGRKSGTVEPNPKTPRFHDGGIVGGASAAPAATTIASSSAALAANEVPAILMGGPKGKREEVLHARDPRHSDNIAPSLLQALKGGVGGDAIAKAIGGLGGEGGRAVGGIGGPGGDATVTQTNAGPIGAVTPRAPKAEPKRSFRVLHDGGLVGKQRSIPVNVFAPTIKYHDGGIVGQRTDLRGLPINVFVDASKYHEGGVAGAPGAPGGSASAIGGAGGPGGVGASAGQTIVGLTAVGGLGGDGVGGKGGDARSIFVSAAQQIIVPALKMIQGAAGIGGEAIAKAIGGLGGPGGNASAGSVGGIGGKGGLGGPGGASIGGQGIGGQAFAIGGPGGLGGGAIGGLGGRAVGGIGGDAFAAGGPGGNAIGGDAFATVGQQMARQILTTIAGAPGSKGGDGGPGGLASAIGGMGGVGGIGGIGGNARGGDAFVGSAQLARQILTTIAGAPGGKGGDAIAAARESSSMMRTLVGPTNLISELRKETVNTERFENSTIREIKETGARALGGPVTAGGMYRVNERAPEVLNMGGRQWMMPMADGKVTPQSGGDQRTYNVTVNQNFPSNVSRETIAQGGTKAGRAVQRELSRGTA